MTRLSLSLVGIFFVLFSKAQEVAGAPQMADKFREDGKIYVVITVITMVFVALAIFLAILERKVKKIENQLNDRQKNS